MTAGDQENRDLRLLSQQTWKKVVKAIEESIPVYDQVNELISLGKAQKARNFALARLELRDGICILDGGIGPGSTSKLILSAIKPRLLVGFDESVKQLKTAKTNLASSIAVLQTVRGAFDFLPFREGTFDAIITCYALRDSLDLSRSLEEYSRVCAPSGLFADVDIGKPDSIVKRAGSILYIRFIMPLIAKLAIMGRISGNPWRMIAPTYESLPTNRRLLSEVKRKFRQAEFKEFLMGGLIVIIGRKSPSELHGIDAQNSV